ncbi:MAG TPA: glycosyltransferase family 2 protein [Rubrobacter sp.]|nr:glycosyltransferase family 2 protein [Rubrobacter sp.]
MLIYGISMIRNEVDIVRTNVLYHLALGFDRLLIVDNGSTDGTTEALKQIGDRDPRVRWHRDEGPYKQREIMTVLAREAHADGADWVVQIDADEFWYAAGRSFRDVLETSDAGVLRAEVENFIQRRDQRESSPAALLHMTRRAASPIWPPGRAQDLVESRKIGFVEKTYPRKCISRPTAEIEIEAGNHRVSGVDGQGRRTDELFCFHAPIRSRASLEERVRTATRPAEAGRKPGQGRYRRMLEGFDDEAVDREWEANSYEDGHLDVYGERHPVVFDPRLRDAVSPFVSRPFWKRLLSPLQR